MASNQKTPSGASRDPVTGSPLLPGTVRLVLCDYDPARHPMHRSTIPYQLHCREEERVHRDGHEGDLAERLGCNAWHPAFARYLAEGERSTRRQKREWWRNPVILDQLATHAHAADATFTLEELQVTLAWMRDGTPIPAARLAWAARAERRVLRYLKKSLGFGQAA